jgi:hypothetical protein
MEAKQDKGIIYMGYQMGLESGVKPSVWGTSLTSTLKREDEGREDVKWEWKKAKNKSSDEDP